MDGQFTGSFVLQHVRLVVTKSYFKFSRGGAYILQVAYIYFLRGKKDATSFSRQACFVNRFTLQGFNERIFM